MRDPAKIKEKILEDVLESSSYQLEESARNIEKIKSILHWAKTPRERTAVNIILDDQKKAAKALARLVDDLSDMAGN